MQLYEFSAQDRSYTTRIENVQDFAHFVRATYEVGLHQGAIETRRRRYKAVYRKGLASGLFQHQSINNTSKRKADVELHSCSPVESGTKKTSTAIYIACITPFSLV